MRLGLPKRDCSISNRRSLFLFGKYVLVTVLTLTIGIALVELDPLDGKSVDERFNLGE